MRRVLRHTQSAVMTHLYPHDLIVWLTEPIVWRFDRGLLFLWSLIVLTLGVGDTVTTTHAVFALGGTEVNPVMNAVLTHYGAWGFVLVKALTLPVLFGLTSLQLWYGGRTAAYVSSVALLLLGTAVTVNNAYRIIIL